MDQNITDGKQDPHEIIKIRGESSLHEYLISETQKVYRMQVVTINNIHIVNSGDSNFFWDEPNHS